MIVRTIFGTLATSALVLGSTTAPAIASSGHHHHHADEVKLLVCVKFDDRHGDDDDDDGDHHGDRAGHHDHGDDEGEVNIYARTDEDRAHASLRDHECARFELEFHRNFLRVGAFPQQDEWGHKRLVEFKLFGDVEDSWVHRNRVGIRFEDDDHPFVGVGVLVPCDHHHHGDGGDDDDDDDR
jgi:hypothetical protein